MSFVKKRAGCVDEEIDRGNNVATPYFREKVGKCLGRVGRIFLRTVDIDAPPLFSRTNLYVEASKEDLVGAPNSGTFLGKNRRSGRPSGTTDEAVEGIRVLHLIDSTNTGGVQTLLKVLFETQKNNKDIFLYALRRAPVILRVEHENYRIAKLTGKISSALGIFAVYVLIKKQQISILHCHQIKSQLMGALLKVFFFKNLKIVFHEHGPILSDTPHNFVFRFYVPFCKFCKRHFDLFIGVSKVTKQEMISKAGIPSRKILVMYNCVNLENFKNALSSQARKDGRERLGIRRDEYVIGLVGRLAKIKGFEYLIAALPLLGFKYKAVIVGHGPERENLEELAVNEGVASNVIFLGYRDYLPTIYPIFDVLVAPSLSESFGLMAIEAQAAGVPAIVSSVGGLPEVVSDGENGLVVPPRDVGAIAEKLIALRHDPSLGHKLIQNGLENAARFGVDDYIRKLEKAYSSLI
jgi:glycosyltransferase involved in cell wall biosynthesis